MKTSMFEGANYRIDFELDVTDLTRDNTVLPVTTVTITSKKLKNPIKGQAIYNPKDRYNSLVAERKAIQNGLKNRKLSRSTRANIWTEYFTFRPKAIDSK